MPKLNKAASGHLSTIVVGIVLCTAAIWIALNADSFPHVSFRWVLLALCTVAVVGDYIYLCRAYARFIWFWLDILAVVVAHTIFFAAYFRSVQYPNIFVFLPAAVVEFVLLVVLIEYHADKAGVPTARGD